MDNSGSLICREEPKRVEEGQPVVEAGSQPVVEAGQLFSFEASSAAAATGGAAYLELKELPCPLFYFVPAAPLDWLLHACVPVVPPKEEEGPGSQHHPNLIELLLRVLLLLPLG